MKDVIKNILYFQKVGEEEVIIVCGYVDDLTVASSDIILLNNVKAQLAKRYLLWDEGEIHYMLE